WNGDNSLAHAYWIDGLLVPYGLGFVLASVVSLLENRVASLRLYATLAIAVYAIAASLSVWSLVGIWRTANRCIASVGRTFWPRLAKTAVVLGALTLAIQSYSTYLPQLAEFLRIALDRDSFGRIQVAVLDQGRTLELRGAFGTGAAHTVEQILATTPRVQTIILDSNGGRIFEADRIAAIVRERGISTYVEGHCESACTRIFLAAKDRSATPNARIGFHRSGLPGITP